MAADGLKENSILIIGNPLLDISAVTDDQFLQKYGLKANDAILASEQHMPIYEELSRLNNVEYTAGGSAENAARILQWIVRKPNVAVFMGCIGRDKFGEVLEQKAKGDGVNTKYQYHSDPTGTCAVVITGHNRSLCANLSASKHFNVDHIKNNENWAIVEQAQYYYATCYALNVSFESVEMLAKHASANNKVFSLNLSAPYLITWHKDQIASVLEFVDILFGNETEAAQFAKELNLPSNDIKDVAKHISGLPKANGTQRMVVFTQGVNPVIVVKGNELKEFSVPALEPGEILDTNGAGDAFVGGFLAQYILKKPLDTCVKCGTYAAQEVIRRSGCTVPEKPDFHE